MPFENIVIKLSKCKKKFLPFLKYHTSSTIYELKLIWDSIDNLKKRATIPFLNKFLSLILTKTQKYKASGHFFGHWCPGVTQSYESWNSNKGN